MDYREWKEKQQRSDRIWSWLIVLSFICFWPLGIVLILMKNAGRLPVLGTGQSGKTWQSYFDQLVNRQPAPPPAKKPASPKKIGPQGGTALFICGLVLAISGASALAAWLTSGLAFWVSLPTFGAGASLFSGGIVMAIWGLLRNRKARRMRQYAEMIDPNQGWLSIHALADRMNRPYKQVCEDLQKMAEQGVWETAWVDFPRGRLMFTPYSDSTPEPEPAPEPPRTHADKILQQIRADNDLIDDEEISRKIYRIEHLTEKIFDYLEQHPQREDDLRTFMDYYLPQTLKTLEAYARLEAQGIETDAIRQTKAKISGILDKLCDGYEKQLDKLFQTDAMDIYADISVMEQMLQKDGLTEDEFSFISPQK